MTRRHLLKFKKLGIIIIAWVFIGFLIACYDYSVLNSGLSEGSNRNFSFANHIVLSLAAGFLGAVMGGAFLVFFVNEKYRDKPYGFTIAAVLISFAVVVSIITVILAGIVAYVRSGNLLATRESTELFRQFIFDPIHLKNIIAWSSVVAVTQIMLQFNTKFGEGNLFNMIRGKYQTPREEQRIFMFTDLNSSTAIAEKLGDETYHELLKDFFADITNPILDNMGEIYQYVGDEVVVAWKYEDGIQYNRCIECFFDMKKQIQQLSQKYINRYGLVPGFKAGIHCGKVVAGEVGIIKRDITFSGDVLNTTSRIQGKCKEFGVELITSDDLISRLQLDGKYNTQLLGSIKLKGKENDMELSAIVPAAVSIK